MSAALRSRHSIAAASAASSSSSSSLPGNLFWREAEGREQKEKGHWQQQKGHGGVMHILAYISVWGTAGRSRVVLATECPMFKGRRGVLLAPLNHGNF